MLTNKEILIGTGQDLNSFTPYGNKKTGLVLLVAEDLLTLNYIEQLMGYLTVKKQKLKTEFKTELF